MPKALHIELYKTKYPVFIRVERYQKGGTAIVLEIADRVGDCEEGEQFATVSVRLPETDLLHPDEFFVKHWSENAPIVELMLAEKLIEPIPHAPVSTGRIEKVYAYKLTEAANEYIK